jgi:glycosyltransferase involved in cell wall biosynthesis
MKTSQLDPRRDLSSVNVCFLAGTLQNGGAERELFHILQALCQAGAAPRLLSVDRGEFWEDKIRALGVPVTWVGNGRSRLARLLRILKELRKDPPDVLQSQHFFTNAYAAVAARLLRVAGIGAMQNNGHSEVSACGALGGWLGLHLPAIIAANSRMAIQYAVAKGVRPSRLYFLPNIVDTTWFKPSVAPSAQPLTLIAVGRLVKQKRVDRFISILGRLRTDFQLNVRGLIVGSGRPDEDLRPVLEAQARSLGLLPDAIEFRGDVSDMRSVYHEGAVCVLTSDFEGTPNVLLEAMAAGLPVVATRVGGVPEIVLNGQTGFLFEPDDINGLATALAELVKNSELRMEMGRRARAHIEQTHAPERLPAHLRTLYQLALPGKRHWAAPILPDPSI